jgi:squalene-hopene/tetraprenyl-beta-curcumene cyclase
LHEATGRTATPEIVKALDWLKQRQLLDAPGDWQDMRPGLRGGGWPFQYGNDHYPDIDDTAAVGWVMHQVQPERYRESIARVAEWVCGMQSEGGGFASFDVGNTYDYLNEIPFADHGALLDPPTSDVSARCVTFLSLLDESRSEEVRQRCFDFLTQEQEEDGSWFGRWGTNYIYGTWAVLVALGAAKVSPQRSDIKRAVAWLKSAQLPDGGWGEGNDTYYHHKKASRNDPSSAFQTAWAMLGLLAAGEVDSVEVRMGAEYLLRTQQPNGFWNDPGFTAPGFPRVFYLKYHGYDDYFPLWALARYRNLRNAGHA